MSLDARKAHDLARDAYQASTDYFDSNIRSQIEGDIRQWQGVHPTGSKYLSDSYKGRSRLFRPKTRAAVMRNEAIAAEALFSTLDVLSVSARDDRNDANRASAQLMQALLQYRLTSTDNGIPWFLIAMGAYQDAQVSGVVASYHYWRYDAARREDRPWIELLPPENVRFDPAASWLDVVGSSPYVIRLVPMYVKDVLARMTTPDLRTGAPRWKPIAPAQLAAMTKQQWDSTRLARQGQQRTDNIESAGGNVTEFSIVWCHQNIIEWNGQDYVYWTAGTEALLTDPVPLEQQFPHGRRPFVLGFSQLETHKQYPGGLPRVSRDVQAEINEIANARIDNVKFVLAKRYFVRRGRQVDLQSLRRNVPGSATMMTDPEKDVIVHQFSDVTASSYQEQDRLNLDFDDVSGTFSGSSVASNRRLNETVGGMNILTSNQNQLGAYRLRTFVETWVEPALRQVMLLEQEYESDVALLSLAADKAKLWQRYGLSQVTDDVIRADLMLTCNVGMGATNPQEKINNLALALKNLVEILSSNVLVRSGLKPDELIKEVMGAIGYKDGGRFFDLGSDNPQTEALIAIIDDLTQQLNAKHPPELVKAQVEEALARVRNLQAQSVKTGVEAAYSAMQAGEVVVSAPTVAPIADMVLKASGYQVPQPAGVDPDVVPGAPEPSFGGLAQQTEGLDAIPDPRTNTSPMQPPVPAAPLGARAGIETQRFEGGSEHPGGAGSPIPPLQGRPDATSYRPRWFNQWEGERQQETETQRTVEAQRKAQEPRLEDVVNAALAPVVEQLKQLEGEIRRVQDDVRAIDIPAPAPPPPPAPAPQAPVINVEPHIHIDKGGKARVMEITAPSGERYTGAIADDTTQD